MKRGNGIITRRDSQQKRGGCEEATRCALIVASRILKSL